MHLWLGSGSADQFTSADNRPALKHRVSQTGGGERSWPTDAGYWPAEGIDGPELE
jgi:hypothetical protein